MALDEKLIDKRVVARSIKQGRVDSDEYRQMLQELPDLSDRIAGAEDPPQSEQPPAATPTVAEPPHAHTGPASF